MKWLLISTIGKNPGDEFIRIGVQNLIKQVDRSAKITIIDKENSSICNPVEFDKCIWCGMPVFWSLYGNNNWLINWWKYMVGGWPSTSKSNFSVLGAGSFQDWENLHRGADTRGLSNSALQLKNSSYTVTARDPVVNELCSIDFKTLTCPAIFCTAKYKKTKSIKACNLMPGGAHYRDFNTNQSKHWDSIQDKVAKILIKNDFKFFAHREDELKYALSLGWKEEDIVNYKQDTELMLQSYRNVDKFFGNRVHGCIVSRANNADVISCVYDSRQEAVKLSGARTFLPSSIDLIKLSSWAQAEPDFKKCDIKTLELEYIQLLNSFKLA